jgi:hypothetical protein
MVLDNPRYDNGGAEAPGDLKGIFLQAERDGFDEIEDRGEDIGNGNHEGRANHDPEAEPKEGFHLIPQKLSGIRKAPKTST